jgi:hypothetical protein
MSSDVKAARALVKIPLPPYAFIACTETLPFNDIIKRTVGKLLAEKIVGPHAKFLLFLLEFGQNLNEPIY